MKPCITCAIVRPLTAFSRRGRTDQRKRGTCKPCVAARVHGQAWYRALRSRL